MNLSHQLQQLINSSNKGSSFAICVSLTALAVSIFQAYNTHQHDKLMVRPIIRFDSQRDDDLPEVGLKIENVGFGPAIITDFKIFVNRIPVKDWDEAADHCKISQSDKHISFQEEYKTGDIISEKKSQFIFSQFTKYKGGLKDVIDCLEQHLGVSVSYCPVDSTDPKDCAIECSAKGRC